MVSSVSSLSSISQLFAKLDTKSQGYLEQSDLVSAFSQISSSSSSTAASDVFSALDSNSDGKVTESEFSTTLTKLQEELDSQFSQMRMNGHHGGHGAQGMAGTPPTPPQDDAGFTQDELTSQLSEIGSTDSTRASFISNIVQNFAAADTNSDGKVSFSEAQTYNSNSSTDTSSTGTSATSTAAASSSSSTNANSDAQLMFQIMQLMHAYGNFGDNQQNASAASLLSVSA